jgi:hypothetical protein
MERWLPQEEGVQRGDVWPGLSVFFEEALRVREGPPESIQDAHGILLHLLHVCDHPSVETAY